MKNTHVLNTVTSIIDINAKPHLVWTHITNVKIEQFKDPLIFKILNIPKPLRAEVTFEGEGGSRIAYFNSGKKFLQKINKWQPYKEYSFSFNPEKGFKVLYFFELSEGFFRIPTGTYYLDEKQNVTTLQLITQYSIDRRLYHVFNIPARLILGVFQKYLLTSIKKNSECSQ